MISLEEVQRLIQEANRAGLEGRKIVGWIPPLKATDDSCGTFIAEYKKDSLKANPPK